MQYPPRRDDPGTGLKRYIAWFIGLVISNHWKHDARPNLGTRMKKQTFTVHYKDEGKRLFILIAEQLDISKKAAQALIDDKKVLVNGKRRHRAAVISFLGGGLSDGAQGPDVSVIPGIALKQVGVLRDGAAAQYGSDAIAGVINFELDDSSEGGSIDTDDLEFL